MNSVQITEIAKKFIVNENDTKQERLFKFGKFLAENKVPKQDLSKLEYSTVLKILKVK